MGDFEPFVRHMLVCEDVRGDPNNAHVVNVFGLVSTIVSADEPPFPLRHAELCVYLQVTEGRGTGEGRIVAVHADSDQIAFASSAHAISLGTDPLAVLGIVFRIRDCVFPQAGLYWIQFWYNGKVIASQPLLVR